MTARRLRSCLCSHTTPVLPSLCGRRMWPRTCWGSMRGVRGVRERLRCPCEATKFACEYGALSTGTVTIRASAGEFPAQSVTNAPGMIIPGAVLIGG